MRIGVEFLCLIGAFIVLVLVATFLREKRLRKHKGLSREEFINEFAKTAIPRDVPEVVYDHYTASLFFKKLRISPDDSLNHVLQKGEEDIDDDVRFLLRKLGLRLPSEEARIQWTGQMTTARLKQKVTLSLPANSDGSMQPIQTLRDIVLWLDWIRRHQGAGNTQNLSEGPHSV